LKELKAAFEYESNALAAQMLVSFMLYINIFIWYVNELVTEIKID
jgi:hypothetical protein